MKLFSKSFFLSLLAIMLFSTRSAFATLSGKTPLTVTLTTTCAIVQPPCNLADAACPASSFTAIGLTINGIEVLCTQANQDIKQACVDQCVIAKGALTAAYNKSKLDPMADAKYDTQDQTFSRAMCQALKVVTGSAGKTFAAFAIIATGIGFFTGKVSWGLMIGVTAGIATMFGAPSIVAAISGQDTTMNCSIIMPN